MTMPAKLPLLIVVSAACAIAAGGCTQRVVRETSYSPQQFKEYHEREKGVLQRFGEGMDGLFGGGKDKRRR